MQRNDHNTALSLETVIYSPKGIICPEGIWALQAALLLETTKKTENQKRTVGDIVDDFLFFLHETPELEVFSIDCSTGKKEPLDREYFRGRGIRTDLYTDLSNINVNSDGPTKEGKHIYVNKDQFVSFISNGDIPKPRKIQDKSLSTREKETLLKLVIGMAMGGYGHDPKASRTNTAKEIQSDLSLIGLSLDEDTIRKWLKLSAEFLDTTR